MERDEWVALPAKEHKSFGKWWSCTIKDGTGEHVASTFAYSATVAEGRAAIIVDSHNSALRNFGR